MPWELLGRTRLKQMLAFGSVFCLGVVVGTGFLVSVESRTVFSFPSPRVFNCKNLHSEMYSRKPEGSKQYKDVQVEETTS